MDFATWETEATKTMAMRFLIIKKMQISPSKLSNGENI